MAGWDLIGNERSVRALQGGVSSGGANHAYIFVGPQGTGRSAAAKRLAMALNCTGLEPPCGECTQCRRIDGGIHADVQTISIENTEVAKKSISKDQVKEMEKTISNSPYEGRMRIVIFEPADLMSPEAQNSFLKTLEEPPPHAVFVLITANDDRLLETIRSRCAPIEFRLVPTSEIESALAARGIEADRAKLLARLSGGRPGWAITAAGDEKLFERRGAMLEAARSLPRLTVPERFDAAEKLSDAFKRDRDPVFRQLDEWAGWWRDVLLTQSGAGESIANVDEAGAIGADAREYSRNDVARFVQAIVETRAYLADNVQSRVALDALMLAVPQSADARMR